MGSYSIDCGLSGLEIAEHQPCYVATLIPDKYYKNKFKIKMPPIKMIYADYGGFTIAEDVPLFGLVKGDEFDDAFELEDETFVAVDARAFEIVGSLQRDFAHYAGSKTIADDRGILIEKLRAEIPDALALKARFSDGDFPVELKDSWKMLCGIEKIINIGTNNFFENAKSKLYELIDNEQTTDEFFMLYGRAFDLIVGYKELRKTLVPSGRSGPQHGGEQALIPFYKFILAEARARKKAAK